MVGFGFKIVDGFRSEVAPLVERALKDCLPLEVGLYFGDREVLDFLSVQLRGSGLPLAAHLDHRRLSIFDLESREPLLREQLAIAARLGASHVITHLSVSPMARRPEQRKAVLDRLFAVLRSAGRICAEYGLDLHIENTYDDLSFYSRLFKGVLASGIDQVHVCFDLGHAKVWSTDSLGEWLGLLADLNANGMRLHFHLHANRGLSDDHLSFVTAERLGIAGSDGYTGEIDYFQALGEIGERFSEAMKIFEVPTDEAEENLDHVLRRIAEAQRGRSTARLFSSESEIPACCFEG